MSNYNMTVEASSAKSATAAGTTQVNRDCSGATFVIVTTANSGTSPTLTVKVQGSADGTTWYDIPGATTASITTNTTTVLTVYPGVTVAANAAVSQPIPRMFRVHWTIGGTGSPSWTFSVSAAMLQ